MNHAMIHGDIKPSNFQIVMDEDSKKKVLKFIDFGGSCCKLQPNQITSIYYMSPFIQLDEKG